MWDRNDEDGGAAWQVMQLQRESGEWQEGRYEQRLNILVWITWDFSTWAPFLFTLREWEMENGKWVRDAHDAAKRRPGPISHSPFPILAVRHLVAF